MCRYITPKRLKATILVIAYVALYTPISLNMCIYIYIAVNRESIFPFWIKRMEVRKRSATFAIPYIYYIYIYYIYIYYVYAYRLHLNVEIDQQKKHRHMYTPTYAI
jgi:hypothetical protein